jgi:simple sugar transport system substrate-binding protein
MEAFLQETTDIQGVFAQNDEMGLGAAQAIKEAGLNPGDDIKIITVDATAGAFKAMIAGDINTVVECNPLLAPQVYEAALKALNGEELPKWVPSQEGVFYAEDAETILPTRKY